jgi:serine/threonine-protein kinase
VQLTPQPRRRVAVGVLVIALFAAVGGIFAAINWPRSGNQAAAPEPPVQTVFSMPPEPTREPSTAPPSSAPPPSPKAAVPTLSFDDALARLRTAVDDGAEGGEIREDVALDFRNLIRNLSTADARGASDEVAQLRQKIRQRAGEGSVSAATSTVLLARVADLSRATGT